MKRPILVVAIGYIIGIIWGLYLDISIAFLYILIATIFVIYKITNKYKNAKFKIISIHKIFRYIKLFINLKVLITIFISSFIGYEYIKIKNNNYENVYNTLEKQSTIELVGIVESDKIENEYNNKYIVRIEKIKNLNSKKCLNEKIYITTNKTINLEYGDKISIKGNYIRPSSKSNYGRFRL